jgi:hypothetical protein
VTAFDITPETALERRIVEDAEWLEGAAYDGSMSGHPEPRVADHVKEVLDNVERFCGDSPDRERLRLIALTHDTFKHRVRWWLPWRNDHARLARRFAAKHVDDPAVLDVVELHDDAFRAWRYGRRTGNWPEAEARAKALIERLGDRLPLFRAFYRCDNATGNKAPDDREWFDAIAERRGV